MAAAVAVVETVAPLLRRRKVGIHWPNDVYAGGRKLAGILVEVLPGGMHVIGVGVNTNNSVHEAPEDLRHSAVTLRDLTKKRHHHTAILAALLGRLESLLIELGSSPQDVAARADGLCLQRGQLLSVERGRRLTRGRCAGIAPDGALLLDTPAGRKAFSSGIVREVARRGNPRA